MGKILSQFYRIDNSLEDYEKAARILVRDYSEDIFSALLIPVEESLPEPVTNVLVRRFDGSYDISFLYPGKRHIFFGLSKRARAVTHWMPLPILPDQVFYSN